MSNQAPDPADTFNVARHLYAMAERIPYRTAVLYPHSRDAQGRVAYTQRTYRQLHQDSDKLAHGLHGIGIQPGTRTVLMVTPSLDFFTLTFALFKVGAVLVMVDPGMGVSHLGRCLQEAEPEAFIGVRRAHLARQALGWAKQSVRITVGVGSGWPLAQRSLRGLLTGAPGDPFPMLQPGRDDTAAILFTSGSTGIAKGAIYTHGMFSTQVQLLSSVYGIQPGEIDLPTFPLFALFGPALGMTAVIPDMDASRPAKADPKKLVEAIENFGITNLFGSPAVIRLLGKYAAEQELRLPSLRRVISAGAPVAANVIEAFSPMLSPEAEVHTPYGATEALPVSTIGSHTILHETREQTDQGKGICVGCPVPGIEVFIIAIHDQPIPEWSRDQVLAVGEIGEIVVRGPMVSKAYYNRPEATRLAKILDPRDGSTLHRMGDLGYLDREGRIWFCGRKSHRVETAAGTFFTIPCEAIFNTHPAVFRTALVGVPRNGDLVPVVCVERELDQVKRIDDTSLIIALRERGKQFAHTARIKDFLIHPNFPVDIRHNAKIFREKLAVWAKSRLG